MKIAIITPVFPPYKGGIGAVAKSQAERYSFTGDEVVVFTPRYFDEKIDEIGSKYQLERLRPILKYGNAAVLPQLLWKLRNFDKVIFHYPFFGSAELLLLNFIPKDKLTIFYHMDVVGRGLLASFFRFHTRFILPKIISRADKVIVSTLDYARSGAISDILKKEPKKFVEESLTIDTSKFKPREKDLLLLSRLGISPQNKIILFVGGLDSAHYFKGVDVLLAAFKKSILESHKPGSRALASLPGNLKAISYKLVIVGDGNLRSSYETLAKELGIGEFVIFIGSVSEDDLPRYYNLADLFVFPSVDRSEAFGLTLIEALSSGVPAIASALPGVRTLIKEGENGFLVAPGDHLDLAQKMFDFFDGHKFI